MNKNKKGHDKDIWGSRCFSEGKSRPSVCLFYATWIKGKPMKRIECTFHTKGGGISALFMRFTSMRCSPEQVDSESWKRARCLYVLFQVIIEKIHMALGATLACRLQGLSIRMVRRYQEAIFQVHIILFPYHGLALSLKILKLWFKTLDLSLTALDGPLLWTGITEN